MYSGLIDKFLRKVLKNWIKIYSLLVLIIMIMYKFWVIELKLQESKLMKNRHLQPTSL